MKKLFAVLLALTMALSLAACGKQDDASGSGEGAPSGSQSTTPSATGGSGLEGPDFQPKVVDNGSYLDTSGYHYDHEPLNEEFSLSAASGRVGFSQGVEFVYRGGTELKVGILAQVDMIIGEETVCTFYVDPGSSSLIMAPNGNLIYVDALPIRSSMLWEAMDQLENIYLCWRKCGSDDSFEDEATGATYTRMDEEGYRTPDELRATLGQYFSAEKADALLADAMKLMKEKDGVYYVCTDDTRSRRFDYAFSVYEPIDIGMEKMTFKQVSYYYERDEDEVATGLSEGVSRECILTQENGNWVVDQLELPY